MKIKLEVSYEGTNYEGWQRQPEGKLTVQGTLESALQELFGRPIDLIGSSRTDSGVHAVSQFAHFESPRDPAGIKDLCAAIQVRLPRDIAVKNAWIAPDEFDASRSAIKKTYRYVIHCSRRPSALQRQFSTWIKRPLNLDRLNEYASLIIGLHDFSAFKNVGGSAKTTEREIYSAKWHRRSPNRIIFEITGKGFLKQMVRNLVGTMLELDQEQANPLKFKEILDSRDRRRARSTAPAAGLFLYRIYYPESLDNKCRKL